MDNFIVPVGKMNMVMLGKFLGGELGAIPPVTCRGLIRHGRITGEREYLPEVGTVRWLVTKSEAAHFKEEWNISKHGKRWIFSKKGEEGTKKRQRRESEEMPEWARLIVQRLALIEADIHELMAVWMPQKSA